MQHKQASGILLSLWSKWLCCSLLLSLAEKAIDCTLTLQSLWTLNPPRTRSLQLLHQTIKTFIFLPTLVLHSCTAVFVTTNMARPLKHSHYKLMKGKWSNMKVSWNEFPLYIFDEAGFMPAVIARPMNHTWQDKVQEQKALHDFITTDSFCDPTSSIRPAQL